MSFIRSKLILKRLKNGTIARYKYYYEVESEKKGGTVKQRHIRYVGKRAPGQPKGGRLD